MGRKTKRVGFFIVVGSITFCAVIFLLYRYNYIPHRKYDTEFFGIEPYVSQNDKDGDLTDDQTDILQSARLYITQKPRYKSEYYDGGYPDDGYGVCTDVVAQAMLGAGYDLMELVDEDIRQHQKEYDILEPDKHIDFRRVNIKLKNFGILSKLLRIACDTVAETNANGNQKIAFADPIIGSLRSVHSQHSRIQPVIAVKSSLSHQRI